jgi:hypothetical protein
MSVAARSLQVFAVYLILLAGALLLAPNALLQVFCLPATSEVWIRVVGMLLAFLSVYYWIAAVTDDLPIIRATVLCRLTVPVFFVLFVAAGWSRWPLVLFGVVDAAFASWTWWALGRGVARPQAGGR